jgi:predicted RNase H-like nuclease
MVWIAGVDGCRAGWIAAFSNIGTGEWLFRFAPSLEGIVGAEAQLCTVAIDMPTGFAECAERGGRACERSARVLLRRKASSVFPTPCRNALAQESHPDACAANRASGPDRRGVPIQTYGLFSKMRELDQLLRSNRALRSVIFEAHPELAFMQMKGEPLGSRKRQPQGQSERQHLLKAQGFGDVGTRWADCRSQAGLKRDQAGFDDALDAAALCVTAHRIFCRTAICLPANPAPCDREGLPMAIWY